MIDINQIAKDAEILRAMQSGEHIQAMTYIVENLEVRNNGFIEIGSGFGGSFYCWASIFEGTAISIDIPTFMNITVEEQNFRNEYWKKTFGDRVHIIEANSMNINKTLPIIDGILKDNKVDFLFIDANHEYVPTYSDLNNYRKYVRSGGLIGFHDIFHHAHVNGCAKVFNEVEGKKYKTDPAFGWAGIGILHV